LKRRRKIKMRPRSAVQGARFNGAGLRKAFEASESNAAADPAQPQAFGPLYPG
jgi:hypothetical protein